MIRGVVHLDETTAREIMVPRVDMVAAETGIPLAELAELMTQSGHSRVPIFEGDLDHILGIAYAMDILSYLGRDQDSPAVLTPDNIRPAQFIPESKTLEDLLNDIQERRVHMAIVVDEYGGVSGPGHHRGPAGGDRRGDSGRVRRGRAGDRGGQRQGVPDGRPHEASTNWMSCSASPLKATGSTPWVASCTSAWARYPAPATPWSTTA